MEDGHTPIEALYRERVEAFEREAARHERRSRRLANLRLLVFLLGAGGLAAGLWELSTPDWRWLGPGLACLLGFVVLLGLHASVHAGLERARALTALNREALGRMARDWDAVPLPAPPVAPPPSGLADDLDLFGRGSLYHLTCAAHSPQARRLLAGWLLAPQAPSLEELRARQAAVERLAPEVEARQRLLLATRGLAGAEEPRALLAWAEGPAWLAARPWLTWTCRALSAAMVLAIALQATGLLPLPLWMPLVVLNAVLSVVFLAPVNRVFAACAGSARAFDGYAEALGRLGDEAPAAARELRRLERLLGLAEVRLASLVHFPLQALVLWDFHVLGLLEGWQLRAGPAVRGWLEALGRREALGALAALRHEQAGWCLPELSPGAERLTATALGHPLLPPARAVRNDVELGPSGRLLLVTGSNMSGKSTLLRALGVNALLAMAGGPACAHRLALPPVRLATSIRPRDSLAAGESLFLAELRRLKAVVDAAGAADPAPGAARLLYLLDEILLGTNVRERQLAVQAVLRHLLGRPALGALATHDLSLAEAEGLSAAVVPVHFRERLEEAPAGEAPRMSFDYVLRPGLTPTTNALALLRLVGLPGPEA
ncbi:MAG TPA: hypothetical protein PK668_19850 [Myxococcota bacterium]|nr:hypothetical protein [Myxococcota bacterium]HRY95011.1 hypothetical protein [Myxococcota bacterium]HSA21617.1 hypothetical protein [Myxococcota bacterium]